MNGSGDVEHVAMSFCMSTILRCTDSAESAGQELTVAHQKKKQKSVTT